MQILDGSIAATPDGGFVVVAQVGSQLVEQSYRVGGVGDDDCAGRACNCSMALSVSVM